MAPSLDDVVDEFCAGSWGESLSSAAGAEGLCKRGSLALLVRLEDAGIPAELHCLSAYNNDPMHGHFHYVVTVDDQAIDVSARQFDANAPFPLRCSFMEIARPYGKRRRVDFDDPWYWKHIDGIPENWRDLRDTGPPGDLPGWPYDDAVSGEGENVDAG